MARGDQDGQKNDRFHSCISKEEVNDALRKIKISKAVGLDRILGNIWKCLGEKGLEWLTKVF